MPTRLKRRSVWRSLLITAGLIAFQGYLGYSALRGQFGVESHTQMQTDIEALKARSASLTAEIDAYRHRVDLFDAAKLDPDILTERARALLNMAKPDDILVMVNPQTGAPVSGSDDELSENQLSEILSASATQ